MNIGDMTFDDMKAKLVQMNNRLKLVEAEIEKLVIIRDQLLDDIELSETIVMHQWNTRERKSEYEL